MSDIRIVDVADEDTFALLPPCADPAFDHRTCDYWEDAERGSKAARPGWLRPAVPSGDGQARRPSTLSGNPFARDPDDEAANPFAAGGRGRLVFDPFEDDAGDPLADNPFAPKRPSTPARPQGGPRKLGLLGRGLAVFGTYGRVLLVDDVPVAYCQFGPLTAYPRAARVRELYPQLPATPLPAIVTCIATTAEARRQGHALHLVDDVCRELGRRGFAAVEAYPEAGTSADATSAASSRFWLRAGFRLVVDDDRYPVVRRELA